MPEIISPTDRAHYAADLDKMRSANGVAAWLRDIRAKGAAGFAETRFPHYKDEAWRFTDVRPIVNTPFRSNIGASATPVAQDAVNQFLYAEPDWPQLVFVDGFFDARLSKIPKTPGLIIVSLAEAARSHEQSVREHLDKLIDHSSAFTKLNAAFLQDGAFVHAAKGVKLDAPIHCLFLSTGAKQAASYPRNLFVFDESSECSLLETYVGLADSDYLVNGVTEIHVGPNARVIRHKVVRETSASYHLDTTQVRIDRDARFEAFAITLSGRIVRNELCVRFAGPGSEC
ncbi:MAG: SufD family Fe-S cluster assembly protein, partial [Candidatus Hydrogenedentota bacterium]